MKPVEASSINLPVPQFANKAAQTDLKDISIPQPREVSQTDTLQKKANDALDKAESATLDAKKLGVDLAKKEFVGKMISLGIATVALGLAVAATILTGGTGLPLVALASASFLLSIADASCALYDWRSKAGGGEGLAMGGDALANVVKEIATKCGANEESAKTWGRNVSVAGRLSLTLATIWTGFFAPAASLSGNVASYMSGISSAKISASQIWSAYNTVSTKSQDQKQELDVDIKVMEGRLDQMLEDLIPQNEVAQSF
ncbi:hypothetical protein [Vibrio marisflavi]|uniref:Secretion system effector C (SseC) like family protein n=1 Tax=Vibrio marisflavi CECT 7928 TaxID=634439 RepID=A0ABM8ZYI5_9VIBR|nr:hypothetical protein [Vibrio marisflavi]CAH0536022.1 hypothetical protein VMF7928_00118 [Vibrio marisflavi CECT 7928]